MAAFKTIIRSAMKEGGLLDALLALQKEEGYVSENALAALATELQVEMADLYDSASFYSMLRFTPPCPLTIRVCRGTACHSARNRELMEALEKATGVKAGQADAEGKVDLGWVECLGQCQDAPNVLINGKLYTGVDPKGIPQMLKEVQK